MGHILRIVAALNLLPIILLGLRMTPAAATPASVVPLTLEQPIVVPNRFAAAVNRSLSDLEIDSYIDSGVRGPDRALAHRLLKMMPPNLRGDFVYYDGKRLLSNNIKLLTQARVSPNKARGLTTASNSLNPMPQAQKKHDVSFDACSPPDPYPNSGPYVREVSRCGFMGGWGILNLPCYTTSMKFPTENGFTYMEFRDASARLYEAGLFAHYGTPNAQDINPYLSASFGATLQNPSARYSCGQDLALFAGIEAQAGSNQLLFVGIGNVVGGYNPIAEWLSAYGVYTSNTAWLFQAVGGDFAHPGNDAAGIPTACRLCSISKVTSIGQSSDMQSGSSFGINPITSKNALHYDEILFGEWTRACGNQCLQYSSLGGLWYAGQQTYPTNRFARSTFKRDGLVYESYDGVTTGPVYTSSLREADGAFIHSEPPTCNFDSKGYCLGKVVDERKTHQPCGYDGPKFTVGPMYFVVVDRSGVLHDFIWYWRGTPKQLDPHHCIQTVEWLSPGSPAYVLGDGNLPS